MIVIAPTILVRDPTMRWPPVRTKVREVLSITSYDSPKLASLVDYKFIISDKITTQNSVSISNNLMFLYVTDVLYLCAAGERQGPQAQAAGAATQSSTASRPPTITF